MSFIPCLVRGSSPAGEARYALGHPLVLTGGWVEMAVGAGGFADGIVAMGGPVRTPGEPAGHHRGHSDRACSARTGGPVAHRGAFQRDRGYEPGPRPVHHVSIWVGARRPRLLRAIGQLADGWVSPLSTYLPPEDLPAARAAIHHGAAEAGRDPTTIRRITSGRGHRHQRGRLRWRRRGLGAGAGRMAPSAAPRLLHLLAHPRRTTPTRPVRQRRHTSRP